jgi:molybdopterin converting factor small subunit
MVNITIRISPDLQKSYALPAVFASQGSTVGQCLDALAEQYPQTRVWRQGQDGLEQILILLNRETLLSPNTANLARVLAPTDELTIMSLMTGG